MKFWLGIAVALLALSQTRGSAVERIFKRLHEEPPIQTTQNRADEVQTLWIEQKLDHFNESETRTWQMRYMLNDALYKSGAPLFIYLGGEWEISPGRITAGHTYDMAVEHNALLAYTEHRYYGQSRPLPDLSIENIKYLTVNQSLADLAHFIITIKENYEGLSNSKVVVVGGSYSATMATWFMRLYPDLVDGGWASSAPLFAKVNFVEYKEITGQSIVQMGGADCYKRIENGIAEMETMIATKRGAELKALLRLCEPFDVYNDLDVWTLFAYISDTFAGIVQSHSAGQIEGACQKIMSGSDDLSGVAGFLLATYGNARCYDFRYDFITGLTLDTSFNGNIMRQWTFQTCNEFGWYQTSGSSAQPFGTKFPLTYYTTMCVDLFGPQYGNEFTTNQVSTTNQYFDGLNPGVKNIYFTHGQLDPWRAMGIQDSDQATVIPEHAHCRDFESISSSDTAELKASKERIAELVREWVK
ncbi:putative serine protease K12H4.7 [Drosophila subpulchrella]|uniref:putative serine protease K12H4.7 n=1 Tax=Drosophila subpulchrella TaxID=1486046 RepID=UPI0018A16979|nr:putative serine protease K12H4.7 [Drosophila subpulchrella]